MKSRTEFLDGTDQRTQVFRIHVGSDAVAEIEYVAFRLAETGERIAGLASDD